MRYFELKLPLELADQFETPSRTLNLSLGETLGRAILLLSHAMDADDVFITKQGKRIKVLIK